MRSWECGINSQRAILASPPARLVCETEMARRD